MGTQQSIEDKTAELREATREANAALGDLKRAIREIENLVKSAFDEHIARHAERSELIVHERLSEFTRILTVHSNKFQKTIADRWKYIETACVADSHIARLISLHILKDAGGTVETQNAHWHLVKEIPEADGSSTFAFPHSMGWRAKTDSTVDRAIRAAVSKHNPNIELLPVSTAEQKGINEE